MALLFSCSNPSYNDLKREGEVITHLLTEELRQIHSRDDLVEHAPRLQELFNQLVDVIISVKEYKKKHSELIVESLSLNEQNQSDQLRIELNRLLRMEGGQEVLEKVQESALNRLENS
jgi:hypothetical protein